MYTIETEHNGHGVPKFSTQISRTKLLLIHTRNPSQDLRDAGRCRQGSRGPRRLPLLPSEALLLLHTGKAPCIGALGQKVVPIPNNFGGVKLVKLSFKNKSKAYYEDKNMLRGPPLELTKAQAGTKMRSCACGRFRLHSLL